MLVLCGPRAAAQSSVPDTFRLSQAIALALHGSPMLRAAHSRALAATEGVGPAGALPDLELQFGLMNRMASDFSSTTDPMTMNQVQLMQMLPWPGKLGGAKEAAQHGALAAQADALEQERMLTVQVRMAYFDVAYADRAIVVMQRTQGLMRDFLQVATAMYGVGSGAQQDVLRAQVEVARMGEEITRMGQERVAAAARLNAVIGRAATIPVGALELPDSMGPDLPEVDTLLAWALQSRPALLADSERVAAAQASYSAARRELYPDFQVGFQYQSRPQFPNMMSLMLGVNVPLWAGSKQLPLRNQMAAMRDMNEAELLNRRNETVASVIELRARAEQDRNLTHLYRSSILPQGRGSVDAALAGYRVGRVTFMQLVDNQMTVNRYEIETLRLVSDYHQAAGELEALIGRSLAEESSR